VSSSTSPPTAIPAFVEDQVEPAMLGRRLADQVSHRTRIADVQRRCTHRSLAGCAPDLPGHGLRASLVGVSDHDHRTPGG
jgi:hypothetical protein